MIHKAIAIDDDNNFLSAFKTLLESVNIKTETVHDKDEFIRKVFENNYSICFVDLYFEGNQVGFEIIEAIRKKDSETPIFMISSSTDSNSIAHAIEIGANDYIVKPIDRELILSKVAPYIATDDLHRSQLSLFKIPGSGIEASVKLELAIKKIGELGIEFESRHLVSKGMTISVDAPIMREIINKERPVLVTITNSWLKEDKIHYGFFAEFNTSDDDLSKNLRSWLQKLEAENKK